MGAIRNATEFRPSKVLDVAIWKVQKEDDIEIVFRKIVCKDYKCRSQWPRRLSHELSSLSRTLGSWVPIPLETWMSMCVYSVFVLSCVQVAALRPADPPSKESYRLRIRLRN
jgi:hypothetical protein